MNPNWKKILMSVGLVVLGMFMILLQYKYEFISWANVWSARIFILAMMVVISIGMAISKNSLSNKVKVGILSFAAQLGGMLAIGGFGLAQNALGGADFVGASGYWVAFDTLSTPYTSKALEFKIIADTIMKMIPSMVLLIGIISIWIADAPDETENALFSVGLSGGVLLLFGFLGNTIGFTLFA